MSHHPTRHPHRLAPLVSLLVAVAALPPALSAQGSDSPRFKPEETVEGWYHRHEHESWLRAGARRDVIDAVLQRVETASGKRANPEWVDSIETYGPGHWVYEWVAAGDAAMKEAAGAGDGAKAAALDAAIVYYTVASWPHLGLEHDTAALAKARTAYLERGALLHPPVRHVDLETKSTPSRGFLHLPPGDAPFPLLVYTNGSDVTKESNLHFFTRELRHRGIALLTVDLPGIGEARHLSLLEGSEQMLAAAADWARAQPFVRQDAIFLAGASFGGHAAARAFLNVPATGVVSMCGPLHRPFVAPPAVYDALPALTIDGVKSRLGVLGQPSTALAELAPGLSLEATGAWKVRQKVTTPLLVITTNQDPVAPVEDLEPLLAAAEHAETLILDMEGHCPPRWVREPVVAHWMQGLIE